MFNSPANPTEEIPPKNTRSILLERNEIEFCQDRYLSMRRLSNRLLFLAIFPTVFSFWLNSFSGVECL